MNTPVTIDQDAALTAAAGRLRDEFGGVLHADTIAAFLRHSYDELAGRARYPQHLPLLAERFARQRLTALARIETEVRDGKPVVLFLCAHNSGRSQMAMGFLRQHAGDRAVGWSGGSHPAELVNSAVIEAMAERGIDISAEYPKPWTDEVLQAADVIVTMGCGDACPVLPGKTYEEWELTDPEGMGLTDVRAIRDDVERRVLDLLDRLAAARSSQ